MNHLCTFVFEFIFELLYEFVFMCVFILLFPPMFEFIIGDEVVAGVGVVLVTYPVFEFALRRFILFAVVVQPIKPPEIIAKRLKPKIFFIFVLSKKTRNRKTFTFKKLSCFAVNGSTINMLTAMVIGPFLFKVFSVLGCSWRDT